MRKSKWIACAVSAALTLSMCAGCQGNDPLKDAVVGENSFILTLYPDIAPITCENFQSLVEAGFYNGLTFHRIVDGFIAQGGDPHGDGTGGSGKTITGEFKENGVANNLSHRRGAVSMARADDFNSATCQFFICYQDLTYLDGTYAAFAEVTEGMEVVDSFLEVPRSVGRMGEISVPEEPVVMSYVGMIAADAAGNPRVQIVMDVPEIAAKDGEESPETSDVPTETASENAQTQSETASDETQPAVG